MPFALRRPAGATGRSQKACLSLTCCCLRCHFRNTIYDVFKNKKAWKEMPKDEDGIYVDSPDWDIIFCDRSWVAANFDHLRLEVGSPPPVAACPLCRLPPLPPVPSQPGMCRHVVPLLRRVAGRFPEREKRERAEREG